MGDLPHLPLIESIGPLVYLPYIAKRNFTWIVIQKPSDINSRLGHLRYGFFGNIDVPKALGLQGSGTDPWGRPEQDAEDAPYSSARHDVDEDPYSLPL